MRKAPDQHIKGETTWLNPTIPLLAMRFRHGTHWTHDHDFLEIALVLEGEGQHIGMYGMQPFVANDVFILRPGAWHGYQSESDFTLYNCCVGMEILNHELAWMRDDTALRAVVFGGSVAFERRKLMTMSLPAESVQRCVGILDALAAATDPAVNRAERAGHLTLYLAELARNLPPEDNSSPQAALHPAVAEATLLLEREHAKRWSLTALAQRLEVAPSYLVRIFKSATGLPPMEYLNRVRVETAAGLLLRTDLSISDVGLKVGWDDPNYFARRFKSQMGTSASQYRRKQGQSDENDAAPRGLTQEVH